MIVTGTAQAATSWSTSLLVPRRSTPSTTRASPPAATVAATTGLSLSTVGSPAKPRSYPLRLSVGLRQRRNRALRRVYQGPDVDVEACRVDQLRFNPCRELSRMPGANDDVGRVVEWRGVDREDPSHPWPPEG